MSKHTPGPWRIKKQKNGRDFEVIGADGFFIFETDVAMFDGEMEEANARLIAAAPDMLEALEAAARVMSHIRDAAIADPLKYVPISAYKEGYNKVRAAIRKARGK